MGSVSKGWPHGERLEMSRSVTDLKQIGIMCRYRALPRSVMEVRVALSSEWNFRLTKDSEFRARVSLIAAQILDKITSGRLLIVVAAMI